MRSAVHIKHQKPNTTQLVSCKRTTELTISLPLASTVAFSPASRVNLASDGMSSCLLALRSFCWFVLGIQQSWSAQARARRDLLRRRDSPPLSNGTLLATQLPLWFLYVSLILRRRGYIHVAIVQKMPLMFVSFRWHLFGNRPCCRGSCVTENAAINANRKTTHSASSTQK